MVSAAVVVVAATASGPAVGQVALEAEAVVAGLESPQQPAVVAAG